MDSYSSSSDIVDAFKDEFKHFKRRDRNPDLSRVVDASKLFGSSNIDVISWKKYTIQASEKSQQLELGLKPTEELHVGELKSNPGLLFLENPFTEAGQRCWIEQCLREYPKKHNVTNLHKLNSYPAEEDFLTNSKALNKLRWVTFGYHHDWDSKVYDTNSFSPFPETLGRLVAYFAKVLGYQDYSPEAAIVNYYHINSTLAGHVDYSEFDKTAPLFSLSFGQSAIFLIGGKSRTVKPTPIFLRSGDIVVMTGESRLAYHAVPRIFQEGSERWLTKGSDILDWKFFANYISDKRININVRQVFPSKS